MPVIKITKYYNKEKNEYQFFDELGNEHKFKSVPKTEYLFYDTDKKGFLKGSDYEKHLDKYQKERLINLEMEDDPNVNHGNNYEVDEVNDEADYYDIDEKYFGKDTKIESDSLSEENEKYLTDFEVVNSLLSEGLGLDNSKEFLTQEVTPDMFNKACKHIYVYDTYSFTKTNSFFQYTISDYAFGLKEALLNKLYIKGDKDTKAYLEEKEKKLNQEKANNGIELIYNDQTNVLPDYRKKEVIDPRERNVINVYDEKMNFSIVEKNVLSTLLGNGKPEKAFHQFLDKEKLKNGIYSYDNKAISNFVKNSFAKEYDIEQFVIGNMRPKDFINSITNCKKNIESCNKEHKFDYTEVHNKKIDEYNEVEKNKEALSFKDFLKKSTRIEELVEEHRKDEYLKVRCEVNRSLINLAKDYKNALDISSKRSFFSRLIHPIDTYRENKAIEAMKKYIDNNLPDGSDFKKNMDDYLESPLYSESEEIALKGLKDSIDEPTDPAKRGIYTKFIRPEHFPDFDVDRNKCKIETVMIDLENKELSDIKEELDELKYELTNVDLKYDEIISAQNSKLDLYNKYCKEKSKDYVSPAISNEEKFKVYKEIVVTDKSIFQNKSVMDIAKNYKALKNKNDSRSFFNKLFNRSEANEEKQILEDLKGYIKNSLTEGTKFKESINSYLNAPYGSKEETIFYNESRDNIKEVETEEGFKKYSNSTKFTEIFQVQNMPEKEVVRKNLDLKPEDLEKGKEKAKVSEIKEVAKEKNIEMKK